MTGVTVGRLWVGAIKPLVVRSGISCIAGQSLPVVWPTSVASGDLRCARSCGRKRKSLGSAFLDLAVASVLTSFILVAEPPPFWGRHPGQSTADLKFFLVADLMETETSSGTSVQSGPADGGLVPNQLAILVPSFDPSKDDIDIWTKKIELLVHAWPEGKITELVTRIILSCSGSAFQKLQLHQSELLKNDRKVIPRLVSLLGGQWGSIPLEKRYECAERALYRCKQLESESNDSFLARADVMWAELLAKGLTLSQLQAYVVLRGSRLSAEDKKRVLVESGAEGGEELSMSKVSKAVRMLGAGFFEELTTGKKTNCLKVFDQNALLVDGEESEKGTDDIFVAEDSWREDEFLEALWTEGDEDASLVCEYEEAAADLIQADPEMASCYNAYLDARRRLADRFRSRGFWPPSQKGRGKGFKGKGKGYGKMQQRKSLQSRILSSNCRLCGQRGHWKAECPLKDGSARSSSTSTGDSASISFTSAQSVDQHGQAVGLPLEFVNLPMIYETPVDEAPVHDELIFVLEEIGPTKALNVLRSRVYGKSEAAVSKSKHVSPSSHGISRNDPLSLFEDSQVLSRSPCLKFDHKESPPDSHEALFASYGSYGVADLGASKTVIGSELVGSLIQNLHPGVRKKLYRCPCNVQFRFGNQATLASREALVVPLNSQLHLKIAVVAGSTPFLLSNALLRTLQAVIDTGRNVMTSHLFHRDIPLKLTDRGLYLIDLNDLCRHCSPQSSTDAMSDIERIEQCPLKTSTSVRSKGQVSTTCCTQDDSELSTVIKESSNVDNIKGPESNQTCQTASCETEVKTTEPIELNSILNTQVSLEGSACVSQPISNGSDSSSCTSANTGGAGGARSIPPLTGESARPCGGFRRQAPGQEVFSGVERRSGVGQVHVFQVRQEPQGNSPCLPEVCRAEDRGVGAIRTTCPGDRPIKFNEPSSRSDCHHGIPCAQSAGQTEGQEQDECLATSISEDQRRGDLRHQRELERGRDASWSNRSRCSSSSRPHAAHGDGPPTDHRSSDQAEGRSVSELDSIVHAMHAGDIDVEAMWNSHRPVNNNLSHPKEKSVFWKLVHQFEQELSNTQSRSQSHFKPSALFEVFCGSSSQLTHQAQQMGMDAHRFGREQCDLQTIEGREFLFTQLTRLRPRNLWFSPECGPWCSWSQLNCSLSLESFDRIHQRRKDNLYQIALGLVLFRHQYREGNHFHWEQPQKSLMFKLPYLQQVLSYTWAAEFDMCEVGKLQDPQNHKMIKKGMEILTTSEEDVLNAAWPFLSTWSWASAHWRYHGYSQESHL